MRETSDLRIASIKAVTPPMEICEEIPITGVAAETTWLARQAIGNVLKGTDNRLMVVAGPCSYTTSARQGNTPDVLKSWLKNTGMTC